jgi:hypothetical protein
MITRYSSGINLSISNNRIINTLHQFIPIIMSCVIIFQGHSDTRILLASATHPGSKCSLIVVVAELRLAHRGSGHILHEYRLKGTNHLSQANTYYAEYIILY